jgi:hypothetical protein
VARPSSKRDCVRLASESDRDLEQGVFDWGGIVGGEIVAAAMIDRLVHHAEILSLKGDSYRLKDRDLARLPSTD